MYFQRLVLVAGCLTCFNIIALSTPYCSGQENPPLRATFSFPGKPIPLHGLLKVSMKIGNQSDNDYRIALGLDREQAITMTVTRPNGIVSKVTKQMTEGMHDPGNVVIGPMSTYTQSLILNRWYKFDVPGTYHVLLSIAAPVIGYSTWSVRAAMGGEVIVSPRDAAYLQINANSCWK